MEYSQCPSWNDVFDIPGRGPGLVMIRSVTDQSTIMRSHRTRTCLSMSTRIQRTKNHSILWLTHLHQWEVVKQMSTPYCEQLIYIKSKLSDQESLITELNRFTLDQDSLHGKLCMLYWLWPTQSSCPHGRSGSPGQNFNFESLFKKSRPGILICPNATLSTWLILVAQWAASRDSVLPKLRY